MVDYGSSLMSCVEDEHSKHGIMSIHVYVPQ